MSSKSPKLLPSKPSNLPIKVKKDMEEDSKISVTLEKDSAGKSLPQMILNGSCVLTVWKKKKNGWKLSYWLKDKLLFSPMTKFLKEQPKWPTLLESPLPLYINKPDPMEKKSTPKSEKPLEWSNPNGRTYKTGLLVLYIVEEVPPLYTECVLWELDLMPNLVKEKPSSLNHVTKTLVLPKREKKKKENPLPLKLKWWEFLIDPKDMKPVLSWKEIWKSSEEMSETSRSPLESPPELFWITWPSPFSKPLNSIPFFSPLDYKIYLSLKLKEMITVSPLKTPSKENKSNYVPLLPFKDKPWNKEEMNGLNKSDSSKITVTNLWEFKTLILISLTLKKLKSNKKNKKLLITPLLELKEEMKEVLWDPLLD